MNIRRRIEKFKNNMKTAGMVAALGTMTLNSSAQTVTKDKQENKIETVERKIAFYDKNGNELGYAMFGDILPKDKKNNNLFFYYKNSGAKEIGGSCNVRYNDEFNKRYIDEYIKSGNIRGALIFSLDRGVSCEMLKYVLSKGGEKYINVKDDNITPLEKALYEWADEENRQHHTSLLADKYVVKKSDDLYVIMGDDISECIGLAMSSIMKQNKNKQRMENFQKKVELLINKGGDLNIVSAFLKRGYYKEKAPKTYKFLNHVVSEQAQLNKMKQNQGR